MNETQAKPIRRRRRRLIAVLLLVLVWMVAWWFWPRGDARFVGKWTTHRPGHGPPFGTLELWSNGRGVVVKALGKTKPSYLHWKTVGDTLHVGIKPPGIPQTMWPEAAGTLYRLIGISAELYPALLDAVSIEPNVIRFRRPEGDEPSQPFWTDRLERIPE